MRKEVIIAVFAGLTLGLLLAFGIYRVNSSDTFQKNLDAPSQNQNTTGSDQNTTQTSKLSLANIEDGTIFTSSPINIEGLSTAGNLIIISTASEDFVLETQTDGSFSQDIKPTIGVNIITVLSYNKVSQTSETVSNTIVYYPEFEKDLNLNDEN